MIYLRNAWAELRRFVIVTVDKLLGRGGEIARLTMQIERLKADNDRLLIIESRYHEVDYNNNERTRHFRSWYRDNRDQVEELQRIVDSQRRDIEWLQANAEANLSRLLKHMQLTSRQPSLSLSDRLRSEVIWNSDGAVDRIGDPHIKALFGIAPSDFTSRSQSHYARGLTYGCREHPSPRDLYDLFAKQVGLYCAYSGQRITVANADIDHIIPLAAGGANDASNMVWVDSSLNRSKGALFLDVWAKRKGIEREWIAQRLNAISQGDKAVDDAA